MIPSLVYKPAGDSAIIIKTGNEISEVQNKLVRKLVFGLEREKIPGIVDFIPSYNELMICYDPLEISFHQLLDGLHSLENRLNDVVLPEPVAIRVPVLYGGDAGPDLLEVAKLNGLTPEEVIEIHTSAEYLIYMLGFTPGFCYLGGMDERIAAPRKEEPRLKIPAGSVGIAGKQTGIYPIDSPGGWQLIGKTPLRLFDPQRDPLFLCSPGDYIRFFRIEEKDYIRILEISEKGIRSAESR
jgi:KipI family sensor histidine kinase inhibitor